MVALTCAVLLRSGVVTKNRPSMTVKARTLTDRYSSSPIAKVRSGRTEMFMTPTNMKATSMISACVPADRLRPNTCARARQQAKEHQSVV